MKKTLITILLASLATSTFAKEYWVTGVNENGGWVDQDKAKSPEYDKYGPGYFDNRADGDGFLCWAASATDILTWWHNQNPGAAQLNPTAPHKQGEIWELFKNNFQNNSGSASGGIDWYMKGIIPTAEPTPRNSNTIAPAGYYSGQLEDSQYFDIRQFDPKYVETEDDIVYWPEAYDGPEVDVYLEIANKMTNLIDQGYIISLGIGGITGTKHATTLWGVETNEDGYLTKMWITDSDDNLNGYGTGLIELKCTMMTNEIMVTDEIKYGDQYAYGITSPYAVYKEEEFPGKKGRLWYEYNLDLDEPRNDYFYDFSAFKFSTVAYQGVPEPTTGTLGLLALAGLAARRRRK